MSSTLFIDGFEQFKNASNPPLPDALARAGYDRLGTSFMTLAGRLGGTALSLSDSAIVRRLPWSDRFFSAGCAVFMYTRNTVLTLKTPDGMTLACAWIDAATGIPHLNGVEGGSAPAMKVWYYFEIIIDRQSQLMSLLINNRAEVTDIPMPAAGLAATELLVTWGTQTPTELPGMGALPDVGGNTYYDDIYAHDAYKLGTLAITTRFPTANMAVTWIPVPDTLANWEIVASVPPEPLDKNVSSDALGDADAYVSNKPLVNSNAILATGVCVLVRKSSLLNTKLGVFIGDDAAATRRDAVLSVGLYWTTRYHAFYQVAGDTKAGIEAAPFGFLVAPP